MVMVVVTVPLSSELGTLDQGLCFTDEVIVCGFPVREELFMEWVTGMTDKSYVIVTSCTFLGFIDIGAVPMRCNILRTSCHETCI